MFSQEGKGGGGGGGWGGGGTPRDLDEEMFLQGRKRLTLKGR